MGSLLRLAGWHTEEVCSLCTPKAFLSAALSFPFPLYFFLKTLFLDCSVFDSFLGLLHYVWISYARLRWLWLLTGGADYRELPKPKANKCNWICQRSCVYNRVDIYWMFRFDILVLFAYTWASYIKGGFLLFTGSLGLTSWYQLLLLLDCAITRLL